MTPLQHLLERVKADDGPDRDLDGLIHKKLIGLRQYESIYERSDGNLCLRYYADPAGPSYGILPRYTSSIDAALALVERLLPGWTAQCLFAADGNTVLLYKPTVPFTAAPRGDSGVLSLPTPALAILAALLSALIAQAHPESPTEK